MFVEIENMTKSRLTLKSVGVATTPFSGVATLRGEATFCGVAALAAVEIGVDSGWAGDIFLGEIGSALVGRGEDLGRLVDLDYMYS